MFPVNNRELGTSFTTWDSSNRYIGSESPHWPGLLSLRTGLWSKALHSQSFHPSPFHRCQTYKPSSPTPDPSSFIFLLYVSSHFGVTFPEGSNVLTNYPIPSLAWQFLVFSPPFFHQPVTLIGSIPGRALFFFMPLEPHSFLALNTIFMLLANLYLWYSEF